MIITATTEVWKCTECGWVWFKREGKEPKRCPHVKCRKLAKSECAGLSPAPVAATGEPEGIQAGEGARQAAKSGKTVETLRGVVERIQGRVMPEAPWEEKAERRECPNCGGELKENLKLKKMYCADEQCGYQGPLKMKRDEFTTLSPSEQLRAMREGRY